MSEPACTNLRIILQREGRSLFQYLREVPPWAAFREQHIVARLRELAASELVEVETLGKLLQRRFGETSHLGAFPDFTPFNDAAMHFMMPAVIREQKSLLAELEHDRGKVTDENALSIIDRLIELKRRHVPELESLQTAKHTFTSVTV